MLNDQTPRKTEWSKRTQPNLEILLTVSGCAETKDNQPCETELDYTHPELNITISINGNRWGIMGPIRRISSEITHKHALIGYVLIAKTPNILQPNIAEIQSFLMAHNSQTTARVTEQITRDVQRMFKLVPAAKKPNRRTETIPHVPVVAG